MSHLMREKIDMKCDGNTPCSMLWGGRWRQVNGVFETWRDTGEWWLGEAEKIFCRLRLADGAIVEVYQSEGEWVLYKVYD